jgi:hypothetical protein
VGFTAALLLANAAMAATPSITLTLAVDGSADLVLVGMPPAAALSVLASQAGFQVLGTEALDTAPITGHLHGSIDAVVAELTGSASKLITYSANTHRLTRLSLLPSGAGAGMVPAPPASQAASANQVTLDDPVPVEETAVGASRVPSDIQRAQVNAALGLAIP